MIDWVAAILELTGDWCIGCKKRIGFILRLMGCVFWVWVAMTAEIFGLLAIVLVAVFINIRNYNKWRK
jgi:hypothetical protein